MAREKSVSEGRFPRRRVLEAPAVALLSAIAGALFIPYALSKGYLTTVIVARGWQFAGLSPVQMALQIHAIEAVPLVFMAFGLASLHIRTGTQGPIATAGVSIAVVGFTMTIATHFGEHLLDPITVPALTGGANWFVWGYYLGWFTIYLGLAIYGVGLTRTDATPGWLHLLFVFLLPTVMVVGIAMAVLDVFTLAGTFRVMLGFTWLLVGRWLWDWSRVPSRSGRSTTGDS